MIGSNRYELPGFLALALKGYSQARYTTYSGDSRGFEQWRSNLPPRARRGVLFAVVGDYAPLSTLQQSERAQPWAIASLQPLGRVTVQRGTQPAAELEFYAFDPAAISRRDQRR